MSQYVPIRVSTLRGDQDIDFDTYIKINDKYVLYLRQGDSFEGERLKRLKEKKLQKMYILADNEENYRGYLAHNIELAYDPNSKKSIADRSAIVHGDQQSKSESVMESPADAAAYQEAKDAVKQFMQFLEREGLQSTKAILDLENADQSIAHHGIAVSTLSLALAAKMKVTDPTKLQLLALGAMLHDIEHFHSGLFINRPLSAMNDLDLEIYKQHPRLGAQRTADLNHWDPSVIKIIEQHEEYINGKGFPGGLNEIQTDPLAVLVGSANILDRLICFESVPKNDAIAKLMLFAAGRRPMKHLQFLSEIAKELSW